MVVPLLIFRQRNGNVYHFDLALQTGNSVGIATGGFVIGSHLSTSPALKWRYGGEKNAGYVYIRLYLACC